jgi:hypothetical protein
VDPLVLMVSILYSSHPVQSGIDLDEVRSEWRVASGECERVKYLSQVTFTYLGARTFTYQNLLDGPHIFTRSISWMFPEIHSPRKRNRNMFTPTTVHKIVGTRNQPRPTVQDATAQSFAGMDAAQGCRSVVVCEILRRTSG